LVKTPFVSKNDPKYYNEFEISKSQFPGGKILFFFLHKNNFQEELLELSKIEYDVTKKTLFTE